MFIWQPTPSVPLKMSSGVQNMKTEPDTLGNAQNEFGSAKHENGTRHPRYRPKCVRERKTWKRDPMPSYRRKRIWKRKTWKWDSTPSVLRKMRTRAQNMKIGLAAFDSARNGSGGVKHENWARCPRFRPNGFGAQNMKTRPDAFSSAGNEFGSAQYENGTRRSPYHRKRIRVRKTWKLDPTPSVPPKTRPGAHDMKTGPEALGTVQNESGSAKHENEIWRPRYRLKWVRERKTWKRNPAPSISLKMSPEAPNMKTGPNALGTA
jgi:hypothetical protein